MINLPRIYCDMDGVLCDFKSAAEKVTGMPISKWMYSSKLEKWSPIKNTPKFWHTMPWEPGVKNFGITYQNLNHIFYQLMLKKCTTQIVYLANHIGLKQI